MKNLHLTLIFCCLTFTVFAQTSQGTFSIGGTLGITKSSFEYSDDFISGEIKGTTTLFAPSFGFFIADKMELGLTCGYSNTKTKFIPEDDKAEPGPTFTETIIGPYFKYFISTENENFAFTINTSMVFGFSKTSYDDTGLGEDTKGDSFQLSVSPGFTYFFTKKIGVDFELQGIAFRRMDPNTDSQVDGDAESEFIFGLSSLSPSLGFKFYLGK